jgi:hypothetical protein
MAPLRAKRVKGILQSLGECEKKFYDEIIKLAKIILVMPALSERARSS